MDIHNLVSRYSHHDQPAARSALGGVIDACRDGQLGYTAAAAAVSDVRLQDFFRALAKQRAQFARTLTEHSVWLGGPPDPGPGLGGKIHRAWMQARGKIERGAAVALLAECERGEHGALGAFEHALSIPMPEDLRLILLSQTAQVREAHDRIDRMWGRS